MKQTYFLSQYHSAIAQLIIPVLLCIHYPATTFLNMQNNLGSLLLIKISMLSFQSQQFKIDVQKMYLMCLKKTFF